MNFKQILLIITVSIVSLVGRAQYYGDVGGDYINLPNPTPPGGYEILTAIFSTDSKYLDVYQGTSRVKILSYFTGSQNVKCDYYCVRQYYVGGKLYQDQRQLVAYYQIYCNYDPNSGGGGSGGGGGTGGGGTVPSGWTQQGDITTCTYNTAEGIPMKFIIVNKESKYCSPYGDGYNISCIDRNTSGVVTVPSEVNGYRVYNTGSYAFQDCEKLTSINFPSSTVSTSTASFRRCNGLTSLDFLSQVTNIYGHAFESCKGLVNIVIPNSIEYIYKEAFAMCSNIKTITIGTGIKKIYGDAFWACNSIESVTCLSQTPPTTDGNPFDYTSYKNAVLYVPSQAAKSNYSSATYWKDFKEIKVIGETTPKLELSANPSGGSVTSGTRVYLTASANGSTVSDAEIYYTTSGFAPSKSSNRYIPSSGIPITKETLLKAIAYKDGYDTSEVGSWTYTVIETGIEINATNFPDANFRNYLLEQGYGKDGKLTQAELNNVTYLNVENKSIKDLKGVEYFIALKSLHCGMNHLTFLDISKNVNLDHLYCERNQLSSLNFSNNKLLVYVDMSYNRIQLSYMDELVNSLPKNTTNVPHKLMVANLFYNSDGNFCTKTQVANIKAKGWTPYCYISDSWVEYEGLNEDQLVEINRTNFPDDNFRKWVVDHFHEGALTNYEIENTTSIFIENEDISNLKGIEFFTNLAIFQCYDNQLTYVDISKNTKLEQLILTRNKLEELDVSKNIALWRIACGWNQLTTLDLRNNINLKELSCNVNFIKGADMDALINSLPSRTLDGTNLLYVIRPLEADEHNVCTKRQVASAKAKGWTVKYWDGTQNLDYEGSDETSSIKGDVNGDGQVNGTDYVALTNIVLGKNAKTDAADVNGDGQVNGTDYVALVNIVLGRSQAPRRAATDAARLSIDPSFDIKAGETKEMVINLTNPNDEITLVQFDLSLPNGLSVKQTGGEYVYDIADRTTWRKHSLEANATGGIIRFLLASSSNATLSGTEGGIITITVTADKDFSGGDIKLENILMVSPDEKETKQDTYTYTIGQTSPTPSASAVLAIEPFNIAAGGEAEMVIDLTNPSDQITLVQFDLRLPDGLSVKQAGGEYVYDIADRTTWRKHSLEANATGGIIRFLLASSSNATLSGTEGAIITMTLKADNTYKGGTVKLENILLVTPDEKEIKPADLSYTIGSTGISSITTDAIDSNTPIYNLRGQRLAAPQKGINIIGGKKVIVK